MSTLFLLYIFVSFIGYPGNHTIPKKNKLIDLDMVLKLLAQTEVPSLA
jgi:hypothetical protein